MDFRVGASWTDDRIDALKALLADGLSASQIAAELGGITRNSVIGKVHRMGLSLNNPLGGSKPRPKRGAVERLPKFTRPAERKVYIRPGRHGGAGRDVQIIELPEITDLPPDESPFACTIDGLTATTCRWPLSDPAYDMRYCGAECEGTYCGRHHAIAYKPAPRRA